MTRRAILLYPDPGLERPAAPVASFGPDVAELAADLADTLAAVSALGLTAVHVGAWRRIMVVRPTPADPPRPYVNPALRWASPETAAHEEGSVSMPGVRAMIVRPARVRIAYRDLDGTEREEEAAGFTAAILQHEIDQLDGIFWTARLSRLKRERLVKRYDKLRRGP